MNLQVKPQATVDEHRYRNTKSSKQIETDTETVHAVGDSGGRQASCLYTNSQPVHISLSRAIFTKITTNIAYCLMK